MNARWARRLARRVLGEYALFRIYALDIPVPGPIKDTECLRFGPIEDPEELARSGDAELREMVEYAGPEAFGFGVWVEGELAAACWYWVGERYRTRGFWPLGEDEAKLVQIATAHRFRGRGIASRLITWSSSRMGEQGFRRLYARIWHSNRASRAAFAKAGWSEVAFVIDIYPLGRRRRLRLVHRRRRK